MNPLPRNPSTAKQVVDCLTWKRWHPSIAFYQGSKVCRRIEADLIRRTIALLRKRRALPDEGPGASRPVPRIGHRYALT